MGIVVFRIHDILVWIRIRRSMPLTNKSWSGFGCGICYFRHWPSRCQQKTNLKKVFLLISLWRYIYIIFQRQKVQKKSQNNRNQGFSYYYWFMIEGTGSGSIPLTSGSGSERLKNMWIRWIRNTGSSHIVNDDNCLMFNFFILWVNCRTIFSSKEKMLHLSFFLLIFYFLHGLIMRCSENIYMQTNCIIYLRGEQRGFYS
jgi:hypothetical protein